MKEVAEKAYIPFDWNMVNDKTHWLEPCEESYYYAEKDYCDIIGKTVTCKIDRPMGTAHPRHKDLVYAVNYGYVEGIVGGDGAWQDVYIIGVDEPLNEFTGRVAAVYHRFNDNEDKWIVAPEGVFFTEEEILKDIEFQEKYFDGVLYMK